MDPEKMKALLIDPEYSTFVEKMMDKEKGIIAPEIAK